MREMWWRPTPFVAGRTMHPDDVLYLEDARPDPDEADAPVTVGDCIGGRYRLLRTLGEGATSVVFEGIDLDNGDAVAAKVLRQGLEGEILARFRLEMHVGRLFQSAHIPRLLQAGRLDDDAHFMIMELARGQTLAQRLEEQGPLGFPAAADLAMQLLAGLSAVHAQGVLHRDVKPQNVVLPPHPDRAFLVKLVDFGICKRISPEWIDLSVTVQGRIIGTPHYMAPEQLRGAAMDCRTDVYSAGALLYEAITNRPPFDGEDLAEVSAAVLRDPIVTPSTPRGDCPMLLERIILRALDRDPSGRYPDAQAMANELHQFVRSGGYPCGAAAWHDVGDDAPDPDLEVRENTRRFPGRGTIEARAPQSHLRLPGRQRVPDGSRKRHAARPAMAAVAATLALIVFGGTGVASSGTGLGWQQAAHTGVASTVQWVQQSRSRCFPPAPLSLPQVDEPTPQPVPTVHPTIPVVGPPPARTTGVPLTTVAPMPSADPVEGRKGKPNPAAKGTPEVDSPPEAARPNPTPQWPAAAPVERSETAADSSRQDETPAAEPAKRVPTGDEAPLPTPERPPTDGLGQAA